MGFRAALRSYKLHWTSLAIMHKAALRTVEDKRITTRYQFPTCYRTDRPFTEANNRKRYLQSPLRKDVW
ncbi:hypothetical protein C8Q73DRAFT_718366 [Cubamyces lactineus]|nr:hypothetical protein C8Q73DRAFT_718366 [Cubamyces lactineus]